MSLGRVEPFIKCICHDDIMPQNEAEVINTAENIKKTLSNVTEKQQQLSIDLSSGKLQVKGSSTQWNDQLVALSIQIEECRTRIKQGFEQLPFVESITCWKLLGELEQICYRERKNNKYMGRLLNRTKDRIEKPIDKNIEPDLSTRVTASCMGLLKYVPLETKRCFKTDIWLFSWHYPATYKIIENMQQTATGLQKIEAGVEEKINKAWQGEYLGMYPATEAPSLRACLNELKQKLKSQHNELEAIGSSIDVQAGISYATTLFAWIDNIERRIAFLAKSTENSRLQVGHVQQLLYRNVSKPTLSLLYATIEALHKLSSQPEDKSTFFEEHKTQIITAVKSALVMLGKNLFVLSNQEQQMEKMILARMSLTWLSDTTLKTLLLKKIIHHLHFTNDAFDISLDLLLTTLETQAEYDNINKEIKKDKECTQLISTYKEKTAFDQDKDVLSRLNNIAFYMNKTSETVSEYTPAQAAYIFGLYARCQQLLYEIENIPASEQSKNRLNSALALTEGLFSAVTSRYDYPKYYSNLHSIVIPEVSEIEKTEYIFPIMYKLLVQALWATKWYEQVEAKKIIDSIATNQLYEGMTDNLRYLLKRLALTRFRSVHSDGLLSATEEAYLPYAYAQHFEAPQFWEHLEDMSSMECGLYSLLYQWKAKKITESTIFTEAAATWRPELSSWWMSMILGYREQLCANTKTKKEEYVQKLRDIENDPELSLNNQFRYVLKRMREGLEEELAKESEKVLTRGVKNLTLSTV